MYEGRKGALDHLPSDRPCDLNMPGWDMQIYHVRYVRGFMIQMKVTIFEFHTKQQTTQ